MGVQRGQPCPKSEPPLLKRDGWVGGVTVSDLHLLIELSSESCHTPATQHNVERPSFITPPHSTKLLWLGSWGWWDVKSSEYHSSVVWLEIIWGLRNFTTLNYDHPRPKQSVICLGTYWAWLPHMKPTHQFSLRRVIIYIRFHLCIFLVNNRPFPLFTVWL